MILKKLNYGFMTMALSSVAVFSLVLSDVSTTTANAAEQPSYVVIDNEVVVPYGIDYYNEQTGEYFRWDVNHTKVNFLSTSKTFNFSIGNKESGSASGFNTDKTCRVCITNTDAVSDINYLAGEGTVYNVK